MLYAICGDKPLSDYKLWNTPSYLDSSSIYVNRSAKTTAVTANKTWSYGTWFSQAHCAKIW